MNLYYLSGADKLYDFYIPAINQSYSQEQMVSVSLYLLSSKYIKIDDFIEYIEEKQNNFKRLETNQEIASNFSNLYERNSMWAPKNFSAIFDPKNPIKRPTNHPRSCSARINGWIIASKHRGLISKFPINRQPHRDVPYQCTRSVRFANDHRRLLRLPLTIGKNFRRGQGRGRWWLNGNW